MPGSCPCVGAQAGGATSRCIRRSRRTSRTRDVRAPKTGSITLPHGFTPLGETARFLGSYVAGHRRQLPLDWTHRDEAAANAARYGIRLADHETWVEPHTRGMPQEARLHFRWTRETRSAR